MGKIYKICNDINDKIYVGETIKSLDKRYVRHINAAKRYAKGGVKEESKLYKAMIKYGIEHFWIELIEEYPEANTRFDLGPYEQFWIAELDTVKNGYNISPGGEGGALFAGHKHSKATKDYLSKIRKGVKQEPDFIKKRSISKTCYYQCLVDGEIVFGNKNKTHDFTKWVKLDGDIPLEENERLKLLEEKEAIISNNRKKGRAKQQLSLDAKFELKYEEALASLENLEFIINQWQDGYSLNNLINDNEIIYYIKLYIKRNNIKRNRTYRRTPTCIHKCRCIEKDIIFDSIKMATMWLKENTLTGRVGSISDCCRGVGESAGGYTWEYVDG